jgi:hypothetical protein
VKTGVEHGIILYKHWDEMYFLAVCSFSAYLRGEERGEYIISL